MPGPTLDRSLFSLSLTLVALRIPARKCSAFMQRLQGHIISRPRIKPIMHAPSDADKRLLLLSEDVTALDLTDLPLALKEFALQEGAEPVQHQMSLGYEYFTADQVLRRLLPDGMEVPGAFEQVGHIAHVNLRDEHLPYRTVIGQVLLDKNSPRIKTVVNKMESISNEFRVFPMEVIAGEERLETQVKENNAIFRLDYREVYWNSRLEREHRRIVQMLSPSDVVCDMFAGIGPFAVPAALRGTAVYANDLNPQSARWLTHNVRANKAERFCRVYNEDARAFVRGLLRCPAEACGSGQTTATTASSSSSSAAAANPAGAAGDASASSSGAEALSFGEFNHVLMNLPASALEFLDVFAGAFRPTAWRGPLPRIHCYCFSKAEDPAADVIARAEAVLGCSLPEAEALVVRDVAPTKLMLCLTFQLPPEVAWAKAGAEGGIASSVAADLDGEAKRQKLADS